MVKTCTNCRYDREGIPDMYCHGCYNHSKHELMPKTNADRIRSMSDEELAEVLNKSACDYYCNYTSECTLGTSCKQGILEWLKSEAKEEA